MHIFGAFLYISSYEIFLNIFLFFLYGFSYKTADSDR